MDAAHKKLNERLDIIDGWLAESGGEALYQILSGSLRGPDDGTGKAQVTQNLRPIAFPRTCTIGHTGMMHNPAQSAVYPDVEGSSAKSSHYRGHTQQAVSYMKAADRIGWNQTTMGWNKQPVAAKKG